MDDASQVEGCADGRVVVGVDGSVPAEHALRWAAREGRLRDAPVCAVLAWAPEGVTRDDCRPPPATSPGNPRWLAQHTLAEVTDRVRADEPGTRIAERVVFGPPVETLLAESTGAALLVVGAGSPTLDSPFTPWVSFACARGAPVPVVVVHEHDELDVAGPVVVGVDGSADSVEAVRWAAGEATSRGQPLVVVHVCEPLPPAYAGLARLVDAATREQAGLAVARRCADAAGLAGADVMLRTVVDSPAAPGLFRAAAGAALLVVGARGLGGFAGLRLGSAAAESVIHGRCCVVVVPPANRDERLRSWPSIAATAA